MANYMDSRSGFVGVTRTSFPPGPAGCPVNWLSFPRIIDVPFETCVAAMESWQRMRERANCASARPCCAGRSNTVATAVPARSKFAWPRGRCAPGFG